jgi:hypothetical protein
MDRDRDASVGGASVGRAICLTTKFLRLLAAGEIATGAALLNPLLPDVLAGAVLTGFSGALLAM